MNRFDFWSDEELEAIQNENMYFEEVINKKPPASDREANLKPKKGTWFKHVL